MHLENVFHFTPWHYLCRSQSIFFLKPEALAVGLSSGIRLYHDIPDKGFQVPRPILFHVVTISHMWLFKVNYINQVI